MTYVEPTHAEQLARIAHLCKTIEEYADNRDFILGDLLADCTAGDTKKHSDLIWAIAQVLQDIEAQGDRTPLRGA